MRNLLKNKKGSALATTVLVVAVVIILTTALLTVVTYALRQSYKSSMRQQAYFTARSAALKFRDYLQGDNYDGPDGTSLVYTGLREGWTADVEFLIPGANGDEPDSRLGTATIRLEKIGSAASKKWKIVSTGKFPNNDSGEVNTAVVYFVDNYEHEPLKSNNRNMIMAANIKDNDGGTRGAEQYFTSSTFLPIGLASANKEDRADNGRTRQILASDYRTYDANNKDRDQHMTHLYSTGETNIDLQSSYYSGYIISEGDLTMVGNGASCYGIRVDGDYDLESRASNLAVYGDIYVTGDIKMDGSSTTVVYGDIYCGGTCEVNNLYVYGNIYACGTQQENGTITGGLLRVNRAQVERFTIGKLNNENVRANTAGITIGPGSTEDQKIQKAILFYNTFESLGENNNVWLPFYNAGYTYQMTMDQLAPYRERLVQKIEEDVYGKASYIKVKDEKDAYLDTLPMATFNENPAAVVPAAGTAVFEYNRAAQAFIINKSCYIDQNVLNQMGNIARNQSLIIDATNEEVDIYIKPGTKIGGGEPLRRGAMAHPFNDIGYVGDNAVRMFFGEGSLLNTFGQDCFISKIGGTGNTLYEQIAIQNGNIATRKFYLPKIRMNNDLNYVEADINDEPNLYFISNRNNVTINMIDTEFYGYVVMPNAETITYNGGTAAIAADNSKVSICVRENDFYGCIYANNFQYNPAGYARTGSKFYFIPPSQTKFMANLSGWIEVIDPDGGGMGGGMVESPFTASPLYTQGTDIGAERSGFKTTMEIGGKTYGQTSYFKFD